MRIHALLLIAAAALLAPVTALAQSTKIGIFDLAKIREAPLDPVVVSHEESNGIVVEGIRYTALPGIRVFAYLTYPSNAKLFATDILIRNQAAEVRIADAKVGFVGFSPCAPDGVAGSDLNPKDGPNFRKTIGGARSQDTFVDDYPNSWLYQQVAVTIRGLDYLATRPEVDMNRVEISGFSYSGVIAALMHAVDDRPCCYVTWNSTGYYADENGNSGDKKSRITRHQYEMYCPSNYAKFGTKPIFVGNSITDYFATLDGAIKMYQDLKCPKSFVWAPNRYHADTARHEYSSSGAWAWQYQGNGGKVATVTEGAFEVKDGKLLYKYYADSPDTPVRTEILYSYGAPGHWIGRTWHRMPSVLHGPDGYVAEIPVYDPSVPVYAVAQIETKSPVDPTKTTCSANCPQLFSPVDGGLKQANAVYPTMLFDFEDQSDLYFGSGEPTFITDAAEGKYAASIESFADGMTHLLNIEPSLWRKDLTEFRFWIKGDGLATSDPVNLYFVRDSDYYLDKKVPNFSQVEICKPNAVFTAGWQEYRIPLDKVKNLSKVDSIWFEAPGRKLLLDGIHTQ